MSRPGKTDNGGSVGNGRLSGISAMSATVATESQARAGTNSDATASATTMPKLFNRVLSRMTMSKIVRIPMTSVLKSTWSRCRNRSIV